MPSSGIFQSSFCLPSLFNVPICYNKYTYIEIQLVSQLTSANYTFLLHILDTRKASLFPNPSSYFTSSVLSQTVSSIIYLQVLKQSGKNKQDKIQYQKLNTPEIILKSRSEIFLLHWLLKSKAQRCDLKEIESLIFKKKKKKKS